MAPEPPPPQSPEQSSSEPPGHEPAAALSPPAAQPPQPPSAPSPAHSRLLPTARARRVARPAPAHQQRAVAALFLAVLSLFGLLGLSNFQRGRYIVGFATVVGALAIWFAITAITRARRSGTASPRGSLTAALIGAVGVLLSGLLLIGFALFGKQAADYSQCLSGANTITAQQSCQHHFVQSIKKSIP
jgi:hypothetical protein